jgi:murein DD-endopeptidase MepM/ murein hydrolase activator NlpD
VGPFLDETDWVALFGYTVFAMNNYPSTGGQHPGLDYGISASRFYNRGTGQFEYGQYGVKYPLIPVYAGCYCNAKEKKVIGNHATYHPGSVTLRHDDYPGLELLYGHLRDIPDFENGQAVYPDTIIGYLHVSNGPARFERHVHIEVRFDGRFINPAPYLSPDMQASLLMHTGNSNLTTYRSGFPSNPLVQPSGYYGQPTRLPIVPLTGNIMPR